MVVPDVDAVLRGNRPFPAVTPMSGDVLLPCRMS